MARCKKIFFFFFKFLRKFRNPIENLYNVVWQFENNHSFRTSDDKFYGNYMDIIT